jgi:hypothetical protein
VWIDSEFKSDAGLAEQRVTFMSNEYFGLINKDKEIAQYLAIGEKLVVVWKGKVYRIVE